MFAFIIRRLLSLVPLLLGVSLLVSLLMYLSPGDFLTQARAAKDIDPAIIEQQERQLGLVNAEGEATAWFVRYGHWMANISPVKYGPWVGQPEVSFSWPILVSLGPIKSKCSPSQTASAGHFHPLAHFDFVCLVHRHPTWHTRGHL